MLYSSRWSFIKSLQWYLRWTNTLLWARNSCCFKLHHGQFPKSCCLFIIPLLQPSSIMALWTHFTTFGQPWWPCEYNIFCIATKSIILSFLSIILSFKKSLYIKIEGVLKWVGEQNELIDKIVGFWFIWSSDLQTRESIFGTIQISFKSMNFRCVTICMRTNVEQTKFLRRMRVTIYHALKL